VTAIDIPNPYVSNSDADNYFTTRWPRVAWSDASEADKTAALTTASEAIDRLNFAGEMANPNQDRQFPRGTDTEVPQAILKATCELAYAFIDGADPSIEAENVNTTGQSLGDVRTTYDRGFAQPHILAGIPSIQAWTYLFPFLRDPNEIQMVRDSRKLGNPQSFI
jgi:hypothetical protein